MALNTVAAPAVFAVTLYLVIFRPRRLNPGLGAMAGAGLALLTGLITPENVLAVGRITWNATLSLVGIILVSLVLDEVGFFRWAALHMARAARGDGRRVFFLTLLLGTAVSILFTNDAAVLILTPIVYEMLEALAFDPRASLPFIMGAGFIADALSLPFSTSNLTNIMTADFFKVPFAFYAARMVWPTLASLVASLAVLFLYFRRDLPRRYDAKALPSPESAIRDRPLFLLGMLVFAVMLASFFGGPLSRWPVSFIILAAAAVLLEEGARRRKVNAAVVVRTAPWPVIVFSIGMYLVVYGLQNAGYVAVLTRAHLTLAARGTVVAAVGAGVIGAVLSSVTNNLPALMLGALALRGAGIATLGGAAAVSGTTAGSGLSTAAGSGAVVGALPAHTQSALVFGNLLGCDIGPKMTPLGSLATLLWMGILERKGVKIGWGYYLKVGLVITPPVLLAALTALGLALR